MNLLARLILSSALLAPGVASAQATQDGFVIPSDIAAAHPTGEWDEVVPTYATGASTNVIGDGTATGGWAPAWSYQIADIATPSPETLVEATGGPAIETTLTGGAGTEAKFRTHINATFVAYEDPIRNWATPGTSHCHQFFGNREVSAFTTRDTLRTLTGSSDGSDAQGGMLNATGYWIPCMIKDDPFADGKDYVVPFESAIVYYSQAPAQAENTHPIPNGLRYVGGLHMDDPDYYDTLVASANAAHGSTRYYVINNITPSRMTRHVWKCGAAEAYELRTLADADPFGGACAASDDLRLELDFPRCWDGVNLWSPGGYKHVIYEIWDNQESELVCPTGWYRIPKAELNIIYDHEGPADYMEWRAGSDDMLATVLGEPVANGYSMHSDWMDGWDEDTRNQWVKYCIGSGLLWLPDPPVPHQCSDSQISDTEKLIARTGGGDVDTTDEATLVPLPTIGAGGTVHH